MNGIRGRAAPVGAAILLGLGLAAAATAASSHRAAAGKEGGTLTVGLTAGEPDALDPTLARTFSGREVFLTFCEKLYDLNSGGEIVPQLATALPGISPDGHSFLFSRDAKDGRAGELFVASDGKGKPWPHMCGKEG